MIANTAQNERRSSTRPARSRDPLLRAKITIPEVPGWVVERPRIEKQIAEGVQGPLTVVTGPPGAGKTMAIASWAAGGGARPVAWVTLDEYDNRPRIFWSYVVAALRQAGITASGAASALARGEAAGHVFLLRLASALSAHDPPVVLILDDLHVVTEQTTLAGLAYVLRNAESGLHLVIASRMDPLLPLHQYRLAGGLTEIRADDLAFSGPEAAVLLAQHDVVLPPHALEFLTKQNEGWAAGLRMAAITMRGYPDPEQFVKNLAAEGSAVAGYLTDEVLNTQPAGIRDLLLCTSILDRVNAEIAGELVNHPHAGSALQKLTEANAFVQHAGRGVYRYHAVFRDVLRLKLRREHPARVADLHRRAARWYQRNGALAEAIRHAAAASDRELAARIIIDEFAVSQLIQPPRGAEIPAEAFRRVPDDTAAPQPYLAAAAARLSDGREQAGNGALAAAEQILGRLPDDQEVPSRLAAAMIHFAMARRAGDFHAAAAAAARLEDLLGVLPGDLVAHPYAYAQVLSSRGALEFWSGNLDRAASLLGRAVSLLDEDEPMPGTSYDLATWRGYLALLEALRGRLGPAAELAARGTVVPADSRAGQPCPSAAVALALVHLERHELNGTRSRLKVADTALRAHPDKLISAIACLVAARDSLAEGRAAVAAEMLRRARNGWSPPSWLEHELTVTQSRVCAAAGDIQAAIDAAGRASPESAIDAAVALARARLAAGDLLGARRALEGAAGIPPGAAPEPVRLDAWLADALVSFRSGDPAQARRSLERALRLGEAQQLRLPFVLERSWLKPALGRHPDLAYTHRDLLEPGLVQSAWVTARPAASQPVPAITEQLTGRERDVLRRVGELLSTAEIAAEMYISANTVKTHLKSIFRKLGAADRREAVRRARKAGLI